MVTMMFVTGQLTGLDTVSAFSVQTSVSGGDRYFFFKGVEVNFVKINKLIHFGCFSLQCMPLKKHAGQKSHSCAITQECFRVQTHNLKGDQSININKI